MYSNLSAPIGMPPYAVGYPAPAHEAPPPPLSLYRRFRCRFAATEFQQNLYHFAREIFPHFVLVLILLALIVPLVLIFVSQGEDRSPHFRVESVSASIKESKWVIGFSVKNPNKITTLHYYRQIDVSIEDATTSSSSHSNNKKYIGASIIPPFIQGPSNTTLFKSTMIAVNAPWPDYNATGFRPDYNATGFRPEPNSVSIVTIKFRTSYLATGFPFLVRPDPDDTFACEDVKVLFSSNATKGVLFGDPLDCY